ELIKAARNIDPTLDIIIITASKEKELLEKSLRHGVINYLIKPVSLERFIEVLKDYRKRKVILEEKEFVDQDTLDELFTQHAPKMQAMKELPKGIDRITLEKVQYFIEKSKSSWTAEEMGKAIGVSRTTARRYLEYL